MEVVVLQQEVMEDQVVQELVHQMVLEQQIKVIMVDRDLQEQILKVSMFPSGISTGDSIPVAITASVIPSKPARLPLAET